LPGRDQLDPLVEGARYRLSAELLRAIWERACADSAGRRDDEQARERFHRWAAQFEVRGGLGVGVGKLTRVGVEIDGIWSESGTADALKPRVPGRATLVEHEARRRSGSRETPVGAENDASAARWPHSFEDDGVLGFRSTVQVDHHAATLYRRAGSSSAIRGDYRAVNSALQQRGSGEPLPFELRRIMERELGASLSGVRIHTDAVAAEASRELGAEAFTVGKDIFFAEGMFAPDTRSGRKLLAHELAHVAQMFRGNPEPAGNGLRVSQPGEPLEREADAIAEHVDQAATPPVRDRAEDGIAASSAAQADLDRAVGPTTLIQRQPSGMVYGPPVATGAGNDFDTFLLQFEALEAAAVAEGFGLHDLITAFRKLYYDSASAAKTYAGAVVGGGVWNILIPGAAGTKLPVSWTTGSMVGVANYLRKHQVLNIAGKQVDIGHLLAGADAAKHPASLSLAAGMVKMRSNQEATTFVGDLGSVVTEYIHGSKASFRDTAMVRSPLLDSYYDGAHAMASPEDMAGNADSYALTLDSSKSLSQNLKDYYAATSGGVNKRSTRFAVAIGLGTLVAGTTFTGNTTTWRDAMVDEVFNSALAYAGGKGWKGDVVNVFADPGPGIVAPTFWEMYFNISGWVVDIFVSRMVAAVAKE
jgi:hypothetical protein